MNDKNKRLSEKQIGDTLYIIESVTGDHAKETVYDKIKRLILRDTKNYQLKAS